nr:hypothetical protein [Tanacetum cinerariifolium]
MIKRKQPRVCVFLDLILESILFKVNYKVTGFRLASIGEGHHLILPITLQKDKCIQFSNYCNRCLDSDGARVKGIKSNSELLELPPLKVGFLEFYKELEAKFWGESEKLMLELRLGKTPSRSFRPVKSAEILWQFWASSPLRVSLAHDGFATGERHLPIESIIASRSTDVMVEPQ